MFRLTPVLLLGCIEQIREIEPQEACDAVGYAVASRTLACTEDEALAVARYEAVEGLDCVVAYSELGHVDDQFDCAAAIGALGCEQVASFADDLGAWLSVDPSCATVLVSP
ncbi:MAG: hypothetical protein KC621_20460 [Myxococcales bacterium]|nr:hypothetical protein [Myxococcales bacterium]